MSPEMHTQHVQVLKRLTQSVFIQACNSRTHKITVYSNVSVIYAKKFLLYLQSGIKKI